MQTIRRGSVGADVKKWQGILGITADGSFGPKTEAATKVFQTAHKLDADGVVGPKTWDAATNSTAVNMPVAAAVSSPTPAPAVAEVINTPPKTGGTTADLDAINVYMSNVSANNSDAAAIRASWSPWYANLGFMDKTMNLDDTLASARAKRDAFNLANARTPAEKAVVQRVITQSADTPKETVISKSGVSHPTIREGSRGDAVADWQRVVGAKTTGVFDTDTKNRTIAFQKSRGLTADGIVGPQTWMMAYANYAATAGNMAPAVVVDTTGAYPPAKAPPPKDITPTGVTGYPNPAAKPIMAPPSGGTRLSAVETHAAVLNAQPVKMPFLKSNAGIGTIGGAGAGTIIGALLGGPVGAAIGAAVGSIGGNVIGKSVA